MYTHTIYVHTIWRTSYCALTETSVLNEKQQHRNNGSTKHMNSAVKWSLQ